MQINLNTFYFQILSTQLAVTHMNGSIIKGEVFEANFASLKSQQVFYKHWNKMEMSSKSNHDANIQPVMSHTETTAYSTRSEHFFGHLPNPPSDSSEIPQPSTSNVHVRVSACELNTGESYPEEKPQSSNSGSSHIFNPINVKVGNQITNRDNRKKHKLSSSKTDIKSFDSHEHCPSKYRVIDINSQFEPSDIVKSLLAKPSVFDEDTKRLERLSEKYVPKQLNLPHISFSKESIYYTPGSSSQLMPSSSVSMLPPATIITNDQPNKIIKTSPTDFKSLPRGPKLSTITELALDNPSKPLTEMRELLSTHQNVNDDLSDSTINSEYVLSNNSARSVKDDTKVYYKGKTCQMFVNNWLDSLGGNNEKICQSRGKSDYRRLSGFRKEENLNEKQLGKQSSSVQFAGERKRPSETIVHSSPSPIGIQENKTNDSYFKKPTEQKNTVNKTSVHESVSTISDEKKTLYLPFKKRACIKQNFADPDHVKIQEKSSPELKDVCSTSRECKSIKNQLLDFNKFETNSTYSKKNINPSVNSKSKNIEKKKDLFKMNQKPDTIKKDKIKTAIDKVYKKDKVNESNAPDELGTDCSSLNKKVTRSSGRFNDLNKLNIDSKISEGDNKKSCSLSKMLNRKNETNILENASKEKKANKNLSNEETEKPSTSSSTPASEDPLFIPYVSMYDKVKTRRYRK